jgi:hypothetical protein
MIWTGTYISALIRYRGSRSLPSCSDPLDEAGRAEAWHQPIIGWCTAHQLLVPRSTEAVPADLEDMGDCRLIIHSFLQDPILIYPEGSKYIEDMGIHRSNPISNEGDDNPLPSWSTIFCGLSPELRSICQLK